MYLRRMMFNFVLCSILLFLTFFSILFSATTAAPLGQSSVEPHLVEREPFGPPAQAAFGAPNEPSFDIPQSGRFSNTLFPYPGAPTTVQPFSLESTPASPTATTLPSSPPPPPIPTTSPSPAVATSPSISPPPPIESTSPIPTVSPTSTEKVSSTSISTQLLPPISTQPPPAATSTPPSTSEHTFPLSFINNLGSSGVHAYVTGLDADGRVFLLTADGSFYYPSTSQTTPQLISAAVAIPLANTDSVTIPAYVSSARVWISDGELQFSVVDSSNGPALVEPTAVNPSDASHDLNWGFIEFTFNAEVGLFADLSYVDFVGIPLGLELQTKTNGNQTALGMPSDAVEQVCSLLKSKAAEDSQPWDDLCVSDSNGNTLRVTSPSVLISNQPTAFNGYWNDYLSSAYAMYATNPLTFNTQSSAGNIACTSESNSSFDCGSSGGSFAKPSASDIFGCNTGPFVVSHSSSLGAAAIVPRLCAALHRGTLTAKPGGDVQPSLPPASYYQDETCNWYSAIVHNVELDGKGYAFPYDDVSPTEADDTAGIVADLQPDVLIVTIGGP